MGVHEKHQQELGLIGKFFESIGLKDKVKHVAIEHPHLGNPNIIVQLDVDIPVHEMMMTSHPLMKYLQHLQGLVLTSDLHVTQTAHLIRERDALQEKVDELTKYKTYYDMQMALNRGVKDE